MQRITITIEDDLLRLVDAAVRRRHYPNRSEAVRDMIRRATAREAAARSETPCLALLGYVYDHETRALAQRLAQTLHASHDLTVASTHVHLDHRSCLEVSILKGTSAAIHDLTETLTTQRGVRHVNLHLVPLETAGPSHDHGPGSAVHSHIHA
jgi:CopG family transcriptional regulator, nickel-responsive regulator